METVGINAGQAGSAPAPNPPTSSRWPAGFLRPRRRWHRGRPILPSRHQRRRQILRVILRSTLVRVALALVLVVHVRSRYEDMLERRASWGETVRVPVMVRDRSAGSVLRAEDLAWRYLPLAAVSAATPRLPVEIAGRRLVSAISAGEVVTATRLSRGPASALRARIGEGRFAVAISIRENRPQLSSGDEVDVVDASGTTAAKRTLVVQTNGDTVTLSVSGDDLRALSRALGGPVLLAARGEEQH